MRKKVWFWSAATTLLAGAALVYAPGLRGPFVFDDATNILHIPGVRLTELTLESLYQAWHSRGDALIGRPIAMVSFALNYYFTEFDVFYFKLTNVVIHLSVGAGLFVLTLMLLRRLRLLDARFLYRDDHLPWLAMAIAGVWLLHPLNLTSVLYVVQRMTSLSALCTVLGLLGYCYGREQIINGERRGLAVVPASVAVFGLLGVLCKENALLVLPLAILLELAFYRFAAHPDLRSAFRAVWFGLLLLPLILAGAVFLVQHERWFGAPAYHLREFTLEERLLTQARVIWFYLRLILLPDIARMGLYHDDFPLSHGLLEPPTTLLSILGIAGLVLAAVAARLRFPVAFFAIGWYLVGHSMESTVLPLEMIHEHRNYLPQYGILFALVYVVGAPSARLTRTLRWRLGFIALYGLLLAGGTYARSLQWQDPISLFTREVINHPQSARSHTMLGAWAHKWGYNDTARKHLAIASDLTPNEAGHLIRLVQHVYVVDGAVPEPLLLELRHRLQHGLVDDVALWTFEPLLKISRDDPKWHDIFVDLYTLAVSRPDLNFGHRRYAAAYRLLGESHEARGRSEKALEYFEKARRLWHHPRIELDLAELYIRHACYGRAEAMIAAVHTGHRELAPAYRERLRELEAQMNNERETAARCAL